MASLVEHFGSPMINQGMQQTISVFNLGGVVQHFSSPTGNPISTFGNPISAFADGGSTDTDNSEQAKDLRDIKSLINEYRNCLMQKAVCCASDKMMQSHVYKQKAMECKLRASKLIDSYNEKYGSMENSPFNMVDMDEMNQYADGGEMVIRYSVYDEEGDLVEMGLTASELIELASTIYYYDAMDSDEENISTLDEAMDGFEAMGYRVTENEYSFADGGAFGKGGSVTKNLKRIVRKGTNYGKIAVNKAKPKAKKIIRKAKLGFDALAKKVAQAYEGKKVAPKYQKQYGKTYSKQEAQEVGNKVAAKVKMMKGL